MIRATLKDNKRGLIALEDHEIAMVLLGDDGNVMRSGDLPLVAVDVSLVHSALASVAQGEVVDILA